MLAADGAAVVTAVLLAAKTGDMQAAGFVLARLIAPVREKPLPVLELPDTSTPAGVEQAQSIIVAAAAAGELTPSEAGALSGLVEARRRSMETVDLADRLAALEARR